MIDELEQLREDVRATAPQPRADFVTKLEDRVEAGFATSKPKRRWRREANLRAPVAALAVSVLFAFVVAGVALNGGETRNGAPANDAPMSGGGGSAAQAPAPAPSEPPFEDLRQGRDDAGQSTERLDGEAFTAKSAPAPGNESAGRRVVERRTALELSAGRDEFDEVTAGVLRVADGTRAVVQSSNVSERDGKGFAVYDLRVPASRLDDALRELSRLGKVTSRSASSQDITRPFQSASARLDDARDERRALLKALQQAETAIEADALRRRIRLARARISIAERDIRVLRRRGDLARVDVTVRGTGQLSDEGATWTPGDALDDAARILEVALGVVVVTLAVALPLLLIGGLLIASSRVVQRRRREGALDPV